MATDPVCGMDVKERSAAGESSFEGETYYFCSKDCKVKFDEDPDLYVDEDDDEEEAESEE